LERKIFKLKQRLQEKSKPKLKPKKPKEHPYNKSEDGKPQLDPLTKN